MADEVMVLHRRAILSPNPSSPKKIELLDFDNMSRLRIIAIRVNELIARVNDG